MDTNIRVARLIFFVRNHHQKKTVLFHQLTWALLCSYYLSMLYVQYVIEIRGGYEINGKQKNPNRAKWLVSILFYLNLRILVVAFVGLDVRRVGLS